MAGYSKTALIKKLGIKADYRVAFHYAPDNYRSLLGDLPPNVEILPLASKNLDFIHAFFTEKSTLVAEIYTLKDAIQTDGLIWISWYKKSAKMPSDITGDVVREVGLDAGLVDVKVAAIDEQWSGLKFVYRVVDR